jgi:hypothetical protein
MIQSDPTRFTFSSARELLAHRAKLDRAERRRGLPAQAQSLRQAIERELERRRMSCMNRFSREAPKFTGKKFEEAAHVDSQHRQKRTTE